MSLPASWVDRIFEKLTVWYGQPFLRQWDGMDLSLVKVDWAYELAGFKDHAYAIQYALSNLPERPLNVGQFRVIARAAPAPDVPRLPEPIAAMPEKVADAIGGILGNWVQRKQDNPAQYCIDRIEAIAKQRGFMSSAQKAMIESCRRVA